MDVLVKYSLPELENFVESLGEMKFRARQLYSWIYSKSARDFDKMTDVKKDFREMLKAHAVILDTKIKKKQVSSDGTIKYLIEYSDGNCAETVLMRFDNRSNLSACVSSQVGCHMGCDFCATAKRGFVRNLEPYEIISQILTIQQDTGLKITNVVFMGQGEPLNNYDNVFSAIKRINEDLNIGIRRITISTCGIADKIKKMCENTLVPTLAISLHCPDSALRRQIMPVENRFPLDTLKDSLKYYCDKTGKRVTLEYILIGNLTDTKEMAQKLCDYIKDLKCNINLIPYNPICEGRYKKSAKKDTMAFKYLLESQGKKVTIRLERGADIDAACGQLAGRE